MRLLPATMAQWQYYAQLPTPYGVQSISGNNGTIGLTQPRQAASFAKRLLCTRTVYLYCMLLLHVLHIHPYYLGNVLPCYVDFLPVVADTALSSLPPPDTPYSVIIVLFSIISLYLKPLSRISKPSLVSSLIHTTHSESF